MLIASTSQTTRPEAATANRERERNRRRVVNAPARSSIDRAKLLRGGVAEKFRPSRSQVRLRHVALVNAAVAH